MKILSNLKYLFQKEVNQETVDFNEVLIEIIDDTFKKKKRLYISYDHLINKLWQSNKSPHQKTLIAKYILSRLSRESERIFIKASLLATRLCPCCSSKKNKSYEQFFHSMSIH